MRTRRQWIFPPKKKKRNCFTTTNFLDTRDYVFFPPTEKTRALQEIGGEEKMRPCLVIILLLLEPDIPLLPAHF